MQCIRAMEESCSSHGACAPLRVIHEASHSAAHAACELHDSYDGFYTVHMLLAACGFNVGG